MCRGSRLTTALLTALAGQLAVAVQNAQLHEHATRLGKEREAALSAERAAAPKGRGVRIGLIARNSVLISTWISIYRRTSRRFHRPGAAPAWPIAGGGG